MQTEAQTLDAATQLSRDLTALIRRAQTLQNERALPAPIASNLSDLIGLLDDAQADTDLALAVERWLEDEPRRERAAIAYDQETAAELRAGE